MYLGSAVAHVHDLLESLAALLGVRGDTGVVVCLSAKGKSYSREFRGGAQV